MHRSTWLNQLVFQKLLTDPAVLHRASGLLRFADVTGLHSAVRKTGLVKLIGDAGKAESMVPRAPSGTGLAKLARLSQKIENPKYKVAYFVGCYASNLAPNEAAATIRVLNRHKVEVVVPQFSCCGIPAPAYGEKSSARRMARKNIDIAGKLNVDAIVTPCASCSSFLKEYGKLLAEDPQWAGKAKDFSAKVKDLSEFLVNIGLLTEMKTIKKRVTYHDPCHLVRYQKIKLPPRTILKSIPGVEFVELKEADMCCGAAGSYAFKNYDLSMKVLARKMDNVEKIAPDFLVSSCPACLMQLNSGVKQRKMPITALSIVELLDRSLAKD
jgi:glycolate oxidase iron-sulfur subunit